jgi:hypothetical protein
VIGEGRRDEQGEMTGHIHSLPIDPERTFTGGIIYIETGKPKPAPVVSQFEI